MAAAGVGWLPSLVYTRNENLIETLKLCLELGDDVRKRLDDIFPGYKTAPEQYAW